MVYLTRIKYTAAQRADIWDRWQRGESLTAIGRLFDRPFSSILICWQRRVVFVLRFDSDHAWHSSPQNAKRYPEGWRVAYLCAPSLRNLAVLPRRSAVNFIAMVVQRVIEPCKQIKQPGIEHVVQNVVNWLATGS